MTASFCKRNSADNEEINHYLTHLLKQDMIPFEEGGWVGVMSHDYTIYKYNTLLFRIKTYDFCPNEFLYHISNCLN